MAFRAFWLRFQVMGANGLCMWSAGLKMMNFQAHADPNHLFIFCFYSQIIKNEMAVLQQRTAA